MSGHHLLFLESEYLKEKAYKTFFCALKLLFCTLYKSVLRYNLTEEAKRKSEYWFDLAKDDLEVAKTMLDSKKFLYVGFFCHLLIEKALKGYFWIAVESEPPFTHNLRYLAEKSGLVSELNEDQLELLDRLMPMQIAGRYPSDKYKMLKSLDALICTQLIIESERFLEWLTELKK